jgi:4-aminobutyrate aminotransferase
MSQAKLAVAPPGAKTEAAPAAHSRVSEELPELKGPLPGPKTQAIIERDKKVTSPSYTRDYPFVMARGRDCMVWDPDGNRFLDMAAGIAVCATGHSHPKVVEAIKRQVDEFLHMSGTDFYYDVQVRLAERLAAAAPLHNKTQGKVFFTNSGTEANEAALKLARFKTRRPNVISFFGAFHGRTYGSMSLTASKAVQKGGFGPFVPGVYHIHYCQPATLKGGPGVSWEKSTLRELQELTARVIPADSLAAIFVEPIQGEGGYVVPSNEWMAGLREFCDKHGILLVADEVQSGMGRAGKMFAIEHSGIKPDIISTAKGIASGLPLGAILADEQVMTWPYGAHASTFGGNPVACAAAHATLDLLESGLMDNALKVGDHLMNRLKAIAQNSPHVYDVRGRGLMIGVEIRDREGNPSPEFRNRLVKEAFHEGMLILGCGPHTVRFAPPLSLTERQADYAADLFEKLLRRLP